MSPQHLNLLLDLLAQPTAPFREEHVVACVGRVLEQANIPFFADPVGNLVVGAASKADYLRRIREKSTEPLRVFIAHMDHPGFHGVEWLSPRRLKVLWHGGAPVKHLVGAAVWLADSHDWAGSGTLRKVALVASKRTIHSAEVLLDEPLDKPANRLYGGFQFRAPVWQRSKKIYTKAADDLVGVFAIVATALALFGAAKRRTASAPPFIGLLTRAEEVGFVGAVGHFELGWLDTKRRPIVCVSLEASRTLPGAIVGKGPVVRLGDRRTVFNPDALKVLADLAEHVLPGKHQRRVMDGGACEATAATAYGFPAIGISVPLGNYHNQGFEGGPDCAHAEGPAPEFVHMDDIAGELVLCRALMQPNLPWGDAWQKQRRALRKNLRSYRQLL
jgi:endoglucanase